MFITLADFDCSWGVEQKVGEKKKEEERGTGGGGGNELELRHGWLERY